MNHSTDLAPRRAAALEQRRKTNLEAALARIDALSKMDLPERDHGGDDCTTLEQHRALHVYPRILNGDVEAAGQVENSAWPLDRLDNKAALATITEFLDQLTDETPMRTLVITGPVGTRKTSAAIALGRRIITTRGLSRLVRYVRFGLYIERIMPDGGLDNPAKFKHTYRNAPVLILDDLGEGLDPGKPASEFVQKETAKLIGERSTAQLVTIVTTNLDHKALGTMFDDRLTSRLGMDAVQATLHGRDYRQPLRITAS